MGVSRVLNGFFKGVKRLLQGCFKGASSCERVLIRVLMCERSVTEPFQGC